MDDFEHFVKQAQGWPARALASRQFGLALEWAEAPENFWKNPASHSPKLAWRGQACSGWSLKSSVQRISNRDFDAIDVVRCSDSELKAKWLAAAASINSLEDDLLDRLRPIPELETASDIEILAWVQHKSSEKKGPEKSNWATRLLDVSSSPLVALYFASQGCPDHPNAECDGRVICFDDIENRVVTNNESKEEIREGIGSIWRPENQTSYQEAQQGEFLITGILTKRLEPTLSFLEDPNEIEKQRDDLDIDGFKAPFVGDTRDVLKELAGWLQVIAVPGIRPAFMAGELAFKKNAGDLFPANVAQSIRISGKAKPFIREALASMGINAETLFPS